MMNDNEIIKALECCTAQENERCKNCPLSKDRLICDEILNQNSLDLIKRQQAEIERLDKCREINVSSIATLHQKLKTAKAEAIKEFAERLKDMHKHNKTSVVSLVTVVDNINNLAKEKTGKCGNLVGSPDTVYEKIKTMGVEELADWLYANCEWLSAEYGACSGANDYKRMLKFLNSADE